jgi:hypothetical protein
MKSPAHTRAGTAILKRCPFTLPVILALGAVAAPTQQSGLVGQWRGVYQGITITIVIQPNGLYTQTAQSGTLTTQQSGPYKIVAANTIVFSVTNWAPKTQQVSHATGAVGGYYTNEPAAKPPGASDKYVFNGPNTMTLTDQTTHGSITMTRTSILWN